MSVQALTWAYALDLPMGPKAALLALANHADGDGVCYPGQARLCRMVGCSERALRRYLDDLQARGIIDRQQRRRADGSRTSDEYRLLGYQPANLAGSAAQATGQSGRTNRPTWPPLPANVAGHEPSVEPPEEPSTPPTPPQADDAIEAALQDEVEAQADQVRIRHASTHDHRVLAAQHAPVWRLLASISSAKRWEQQQLRAVAVRVLQLVRDHGDQPVIAALTDVRTNLAEIRYPMRYVEAHLARAASGQPDDALRALVDQL